VKALALVLVMACSGGGKPPVATGGSGSGSAAVEDKRTPIEKRRDAACDAIEAPLTNCAIDDLKRTMKPADLAKLDLDKMRADHRKRWFELCKRPKTSHQVRVLEVCFKEEKECDPLADCLLHLDDELQNKPAP
jgi:hypothetical protein